MDFAVDNRNFSSVRNDSKFILKVVSIRYFRQDDCCNNTTAKVQFFFQISKLLRIILWVFATEIKDIRGFCRKIISILAY